MSEREVKVNIISPDLTEEETVEAATRIVNGMQEIYDKYEKDKTA